MSSSVSLALVFLACALTLSTGQTSCKGRCGTDYYRGYTCQCDYTCLSYEECCGDYESQCTTKNSCKGRCGEAFRRGRRCSCDYDCQKFNQCCSDFQTYCDAEEEMIGAPSATEPVKSNSCHHVNHKAPKEGTPKDGPAPSPSFSGGHDPDGQLMPLVTPATDPGDLRDELDNLPNNGFSTNGAGDPESTPNPGSSSGDGLSADLGDRSTDSTQDSGSAEFSRETSTVVPPAHSRDEDGVLATLAPTSGQAATDKTGADELSSFSALPQSTVALPSWGELSSAPSTTPGSSDGPPLTQTAPSSAATVGSTIVLENPEWTSSPASSTLEATATTSKGVAVGPLLQELLTTLLPAASDAARDVVRDEVTAGLATNDPSAVTQQPGKTTSKPQDKPSPTKPVSVPQTAKTDDLSGYQADDSNDTDLCSGRPISGVTTLRNGTMVVFRGHYFWVLDRNKVPGAAQGITQVWGVPSPIDTVFTRCNCQGKTYIFKGNQYWRFENGAVDPDYPKPIQVGFDGLRGQITAALSVPQHRQRRESVYFFKRGGVVQKYSYHFTPSPTCGTKPKINIYAVRNRLARQAAASNLGPAIKIRASWSGFPATVTAAVSVPNKQQPDGYKYYIFSRASFYNVRMDSERPALSAPATNMSPQNNFIKCPKKM